MLKPHDKQTCPYCATEYLTVACVADALGLSPFTVYNAGAGTGCLYAGRIKRGAKVFFLRARVAEHKRLEIEFGSCNGNCKKVQPERTRSGLRSVSAAS